MRRFVLLAAASVVLLGSVGAGGEQAGAVDQSKGYPGFCRTDVGVTVVVDFQQLGGTTIVRCNPTKSRGTGLDALKGAGFQIAGVQRWGEAFICRIENRPSARERLPIQGNSGYQERCVDTPPASGYWSYWHAGNNCAWNYSQWGVKNRSFVPGGFEGWSFSLNATADDNPDPRVAPVRPGTAGGRCTTPEEPGPRTDDPGESQADLGAGESPSTATPSNSASDSALPAPRPRDPEESAAAAPDPNADAEFTGGQDAPDVNDVLREESGASAWAPWAAGGAIALLLVAMATTARSRRRRREA